MPRSTTSTVKLKKADSGTIILDTHIAVWLAQTNNRLSPATLKIIERAFDERRLCMSTISAWEIGLLCSRVRLNFAMSPLVWFESFVNQFKINILEITPQIAIESNYLPGNFHKDPADRILVATAIAHSAAVVTADTNLVEYGKQKFVQIIAS